MSEQEWKRQFDEAGIKFMSGKIDIDEYIDRTVSLNKQRRL